MALVTTPQCTIGWKAKDFKLLDIDNGEYNINKVMGKNGLVIVFMCNHCPYVKSIIADLVEDTKKLKEHGINVVGINSNDTVAYPDDSYEMMKNFAKEHNLNFPYLFDEKQEVAKEYGAVCTPDFFGFDRNSLLKYRGRFSDKNISDVDDTNSKHELYNAMLEIAEKGECSFQQRSSMGCSIKWKQ